MDPHDTLLTYHLTDTERGLQGSRTTWQRVALGLGRTDSTRKEIDAALHDAPADAPAIRITRPRDVADALLDAMARG